MKRKKRDNSFKGFIRIIIFLALLFVFIMSFVIFSKQTKRYQDFDWTGIRSEIKDSIVSFEQNSTYNYYGNQNNSPDLYFWFSKNVNNNELKKFTHYPYGKIKAISYAALIRKGNHDNYALIKQALSDTISYISIEEGCLERDYLIGEYLIKDVAFIQRNIPPPPKEYTDRINLTETQIDSLLFLLELRLQKLTALGINEIEVEIKKLAELIAKYKKIISSKKELLKVISEELKNIKEKFAVPRRTKIIDAVLNYDIEETIQKQSVIITVTLQGYIKRGSLDGVKQQKRGGKGKSGITTRDQDSVIQTLSVNTHTSVLFFSTEGLVYKVKAWKIPEGSTTSKGKSLFNILPLKNHQSISSIMPMPENETESKKYQIIFATANGKVRKNSLEDFSSINASGKIAMKLDNNDKIVGVKICEDDQDVILSTKFGKCIRFEAKKLRVFKGRSSKGIKGIELASNDQIVSLSVIDNDKTKKNVKKSKDEQSEIKAKEKFVLSISENGYGKKTSHVDYRVTNRGGKGIIGIVNSPRNGNITSSFPVFEGDEILISTNKGRVIRVAVKEIRTAGRNTQGVRIIKLSGEEKVVSAIKIDDNLI